MELVNLFQKGGPAMYPLLALSILAVSVVFERLWFWLRMLSQERQIVERVLDAARGNWTEAMEIASRACDQPIGRFLYAPLSLPSPDPETFKLALEATAEDELTGMRRGDKVLESIVALAPLLGLLGTVTGLIQSLGGLRIGDLGTESTANVTLGIAEALITTATGLIIAIFSLAFYRLFQAFLFNQVKIFRKAGNDLELLYRQSPVEARNFNAAKALPPITIRESVQDRENIKPPRRKNKNKFGEPPQINSDTSTPEKEAE